MKYKLGWAYYMSRKFLRRELDDIGKRNNNKFSYRSRLLAGRTTTVDAYTGEKIYLNKRYTPNRKINIDHVISIEQVKSWYGDSLEPSELREILVSDYNLVATNESLNKAKGRKSNLKFIIDNYDNLNIVKITNLLKYQLYAEPNIHKDGVGKIITKKIKSCQITLNETIQSSNKHIKDLNLNDEMNFMLYSTALSSAQILYRSYNGELTRAETAKEIAKETGIMIGSVVIDEMLNEIGKLLEKEGLGNVTEFINIQSIVTSINSSITIMRYINSEIDGYQCINSLIFNIIKSPLYAIAYAAGGPLAALITTSIVSDIQYKISAWIIEWQSEVKLSKKQMRRYDKLIEDFNNKINSDRSVISKYIEKQNHLFDSQVLNGYYNLCFSIKNNNSKGITDGLNQILKYFNKEVIFKDLKSFDEFFFDDNQVLKL